MYSLHAGKSVIEVSSLISGKNRDDFVKVTELRRETPQQNILLEVPTLPRPSGTLKSNTRILRNSECPQAAEVPAH